jgi:hypothetical protein
MTNLTLKIVGLCVTLALAACGGGSDGGAPITAAPPETPSNAFTVAVSQLAATAPGDTEPISIDVIAGVESTADITSDTTEPAALPA